MPRLSTIEELTETTTSRATSSTSMTTTNSSKIDTKMKEAVKASQMGEIEKVHELLIQGHVSVDELDEEQCSLMHWAAINGKHEVIEFLITYRANINIIGGLMKSTPLHWACYNSQMYAVISLILNGADASIRNVNGETALHVAARNGNLMIIAYLLVKCENIRDMRDNNGYSALMRAAHSSFGMFPIRIFTKFDVFLDFADDENRETALHTVMQRQNMGGAVELLCAGADETKKNAKGETPFSLVNDKFEKEIREAVATRKIRENGSAWEKVSSRWGLIQLFTASITAIVIGLGVGLFYLTNIYCLLVAMLIAFTLLFYFGRSLRIDQLAFLPVTYICYVGVAELAILLLDSEGFLHWSILLVMSAIWGISATFYWILLLTDPGAKRRSVHPFTEFIENIEQNDVTSYCFTCWIPKNNSSHHCSQCDKCVDGFDHHCPWIHKCVYRKNLRCFVLFCFTNFVFDVLYVPLLMYMLLVSMSVDGYEKTVSDHGLMLVSLIIAIPNAIGAGAITYTQFSQISRHITTIQTIKRCREKQNKSETLQTTTPPSFSDEYNPWNKKPSIRTRIQNVWNLLAFDQFNEDLNEEDDGCTFGTMTASGMTASGGSSI